MRNTEIKRNNKLSKSIIYALAILTILLMLYYVVMRAFPMLQPTQEVYGNYFFPRAVWLFPHILLGIVAILIGPFQFIKKFRNKYLKLHRNLGKIYIISVVLSGLLGMYLAATSNVNLTYAVGLFFLGVTWAGTAIMAFISIKKKKIELHKEWMIRSYVITFAFVTFRVIEDVLKITTEYSNVDVLTLMSWTSWAIPLFIAELFIQGKKLSN